MIYRAGITGIELARLTLENEVDDAYSAALPRALEVIAAEARASHPYQNKTGELERNTKIGEIRGRLSSDNLEGEVIGDTEYGEYVDQKPAYAFLLPAFERVQNEALDALDAAAAAALLAKHRS